MQDFYLDSLSENNIIRNRYFNAQSQLLAFRYLDEVQDLQSPTQAIANDVSRLIVKAKKKYMETEGKVTDIDGKMFLESMKEVACWSDVGPFQTFNLDS